MILPLRICSSALLAVVGLVVGACGAGGSNATPSTPSSVSDLKIEGVPSTLRIGETAQLTASVVLADGLTKNATTSVEWQSSDADVATVSAGGVVRAIGLGIADITASVQEHRAAARVAVRPVQFLVSGVVHETPPTESQSIPNATIAATDSQGESASVQTDGAGHFDVLLSEGPAKVAVSASGFEPVEFTTAVVRDRSGIPADLSVGLAPVLRQIVEQWETPCCDGNFGLSVNRSIPVHHAGMMSVSAYLCFAGCGASEFMYSCVDVRDSHGTVIAHAIGAYDYGATVSVVVRGAESYRLDAYLCHQLNPEWRIKSYFISITHPS